MLPVGAIDAVRAGHYSLLLGAGASAGATSADSLGLPLGNGFAKELIAQFSLDMEETEELRYVWDVARGRVGDDEKLRRLTTVPRFLNCRHAAYHMKFANFPWKRIYSLNVDDVFESAYKNHADCLQKIDSLHYIDDFSEVYKDSDVCQLVHLHGSELFPDKPLVFGPEDYADAVNKSAIWWHVFSQAFFTDPFIVIGATLKEHDFEMYYGQRRTKRRSGIPPSLYVSKQINATAKRICEKYDLIPIEATGEQFVEELVRLIPNCKKLSELAFQSLGSSSAMLTGVGMVDAVSLARNYVFLNEKNTWPSIDVAKEGFYEGRNPEWIDIINNSDIETAVEPILINAIDNRIRSITNRDPHIFIIQSHAGDGKTTSLMRIGATLGDRHQNSLYFSSNEIINIDLLVRCARRLESSDYILLFMDDIDRHTNQLRKLLSEDWSCGARVIVVGASRSYRLPVIANALSGFSAVSIFDIKNLNHDQSKNLAIKLRSVAKLGSYAGKTDKQLAEIFSRNGTGEFNGHLFSVLAKVVPGSILSDRLRTVWDDLPDQDFREFCGIVALSTAAGFPIRSSIALAASGVKDSGKIFSSIGVGALKSVLYWKNDSLYFGHRVVAEKLIDDVLNVDDLYRLSSRLAISIASYVNRKATIQRTAEVGLARFLMNADGAVVPKFGSRGDAWFEEIQMSHEWNSRYWEQRALFAKSRNEFDRAIDFAEQAIAKEFHPLPLTTCANIKIQATAQMSHLGINHQKKLFEEGINLLVQAINLSKSMGMHEIHPYVILFSTAVDVARSVFGKIPPTLIQKLQNYHIEARRRFPADARLNAAVNMLAADGLW